ncbi:hypothetical protein OROMI_031841 [Orobanche minor]
MDKSLPEMAAYTSDDKLSAFLKSGIYRFDDEKTYFIDPVRILNQSYTRFRVSASTYYSRFFPSSKISTENHINTSKNSNKRKRREKEKKRAQALNSREQIADRRHQDVRLALLKAHEALLGASQLLETLRDLRSEGEKCNGEPISQEVDFVELGSVWQAPFYEIMLTVHEDDTTLRSAGVSSYCQLLIPVFDNLIANEGSDDMEAELLDHKYILPKKILTFQTFCFTCHEEVRSQADLQPDSCLIDPPWENSSAHQKLKYQTLPNRYFLSLPIKQLTHSKGALVALWVTNREKLRNFVENELFPKWGVKHAAAFYWLKVKADGFLISELDLFHHRPYECLLLGFSPGKEMNAEQLMRLKHVPDNQVFISVPGDYSRKPPIGELLLDYVPGLNPARCIELFSREMIAGWTSWGNEPLHFQDSRYFRQTTDK